MAEGFSMKCADFEDVGFLADRLYVVRTLVPVGYEAYFRRRARYRSAHTSTAIEGNELGVTQAMVVLVEDQQSFTPAELEVKNLDDAYDLVQQIAGDKSTRVDEGVVRTMNSLILKGLPGNAARTRGKYRVGPNLIINPRTQEVRYRPPPPERVPQLMEGFVADIQGWIDNDTYPGPVIAALAHFGLISIHPFDDGNGRTARLLADMILHKTGWSNEGMLAVSEAILRRQEDYYETLYTTQGVNFAAEVDASPFVNFHTDVLNWAAANLESVVINFNRRRKDFVDGFGEVLNSRQVLGFMFIIDVAPLSSSSYADLTGSSQSTAINDLAEMVEVGCVERVGKGRSTRYRLNRELERQTREALEKKSEVSDNAPA
jgi:Fic family protein